MANKSLDSKYPKGDKRRFFERREKEIDWCVIYEIASSMAKLAKKFLEMEPKVKTAVYSKTIGLKPFIRYSTDFCGEKNGYKISAAAKNALTKTGKIDWGKNGLHYAEHLIPVGQFADEITKNPDIKNIEKMYKKQTTVIMLRKEKAEYDKEPFKSHRSQKDIDDFYRKYGVTTL